MKKLFVALLLAASSTAWGGPESRPYYIVNEVFVMSDIISIDENRVAHFIFRMRPEVGSIIYDAYYDCKNENLAYIVVGSPEHFRPYKYLPNAEMRAAFNQRACREIKKESKWWQFWK